MHWATGFLLPVIRGGRKPTNGGTIRECVGDYLPGERHFFDELFSLQIEAFRRPGEHFILLSGSGNLRNIVRGATARVAVPCVLLGC